MIPAPLSAADQLESTATAPVGGAAPLAAAAPVQTQDVTVAAPAEADSPAVATGGSDFGAFAAEPVPAQAVPGVATLPAPLASGDAPSASVPVGAGSPAAPMPGTAGIFGDAPTSDSAFGGGEAAGTSPSAAISPASCAASVAALALLAVLT